MKVRFFKFFFFFNLIRSITKKSIDYDEKYVKFKFDLDDDLPLNKTIEIHKPTIVARAVIRKFS